MKLGIAAARLIMVVGIIVLAGGCASKNEEAATPPPSTAQAPSEALTWLDKARQAALEMKKFAFEVQLKQKLTGPEQSDVSIVTKGKTERDPLKLDQTIDSTIDGEQSTLRALIVPEAYYMYLPEYEEWSKLSKAEEAENRKTLSDLQTDPAKALQAMDALGDGLTETSDGKTVTIRYEGTGPEATSYVVGLLDSTIGLSSLDPKAGKSVKLSKFNLLLTVDAAKRWPLSFRIESDLSLELEAGKPNELSQTVSGTYFKQNEVAAITVPKEAQEALDPDEIGQELEEGGPGEEP